MPGNPRRSKWFSTTDEARKRRSIELTLSPEALDELEQLAAAALDERGAPLSRSALVERLIRTAAST